MSSAAFGACAVAAPYDVVHFDDDAVSAVDRSTVQRQGTTVRYSVVTLMRIPPELAGAPDEMHHWKETDCTARSTRIVRMALRTPAGLLETPPWAEGDQEPTEIDPAEQRMLCEQGRPLATVLSIDVLRKSLVARAARGASRRD